MTWDWMAPERPYAIAHRGASAYAPGNSLQAFEIAADLGADFWELDLRLCADGEVVVFHDPVLPDGSALADLCYAEILQQAGRAGTAIPRLDQVLDLAIARGAGIYADIKAEAAVVPVLETLKRRGIARAILGAFSFDAIARLPKEVCPYPRAVLIPVGADPFAGTEAADILHLCWERLERPQELLDKDFFGRAEARGQRVVLWHEEDPVRMADLRNKPVLGICSDRPELVNPFRARADWPVEIVCHRGANRFAPENTLAAAHCAFAAGFGYVEIDLRSSADCELFVMHDASLARTTTEPGPIAEQSGTALSKLDAGSWFAPHFSLEKVPTLKAMLELAERYDGALYIELKAAPAEFALEQVRDGGMLEKCFFWSSEFEDLREIRRLSLEAKIMLRRQDYPTLEEAFNDGLQPAIIEYTTTEDWSEFADCRRQGAAVMIAYMGEDEDAMQRIIAARPDLVNLDDPFRFKEICSAMGPTEHG